MPTSVIFAINNEGRVFGLSTNGTKWREFPYPGIDFKHISAVPHYLWAIGSDRQVYLHVHGLDTSIRVKEECYENQRWLPMEGFSGRLLPTDRFAFSSEDGLTERRKEMIRVPSMAWKWESTWKIETTLNNEPLDHDGWTYAVDFPATYYSTKKWSSCVRRRKWVRYRKYIAINSWCAIAPLHSDPTQEPFRDISVGGQNMLGSLPGSLQVWGVTVHGRVMWRKGVHLDCPEGTAWNEIPLSSGMEMKHIACGPEDQVWGINSQGTPVIRQGICAATPTGEKWIDIDNPPNDGKMRQLVVGSKAVWGLTEDGSIWFRKGIGDESSPGGIGWVHMVGFMEALSISSTDQVFGIGAYDRNLYVRYGVTEVELTGKRWKQLQTPVQDSRASSATSLNQPPSMSLINDFMVQKDNPITETSRSAPTSLDINGIWRSGNKKQHGWDTRSDDFYSTQMSSLPNASLEEYVEESAVRDCVSLVKDTSGDRQKLSAWSPVRSVGSVLGLEANPDTDPNADWDGEVFSERESLYDSGWNQLSTLWTYVAAGGLTVDPNHLPNWFSDSGCGSSLEMAQWRCKILQDLQSNNLIRLKGFDKFELAVERSSNNKSVEIKYQIPGSQIYEEGALELEWFGNLGDTIESGTITIMSLDRYLTKFQLLLSEVLCIAPCSEPGSPRLAIHLTESALNSSNQPLILQFGGDIDFDEWHAQLAAVFSNFFTLEGQPKPNSVWLTTKLGDTFVFDPYSLHKHQQEDNKFCKDLAFKHKAVPWSSTLYNGLSEGSSISVFCYIPDDPNRFTINFECESSEKIALHFDVRFYDQLIVRNSKQEGCWKKEDRDGSFAFKGNANYSIDFFCQKDGFQVSIDGIGFAYFEHRIKPEFICKISITGTVHIQKVLYASNKVIMTCNEMILKEMGGHLAVVETSSSGITWGISVDNTPYVYTGGCGGTFLSGYEKSLHGIYPMSDTYIFYVYENQRWNPLSGFTSRGLPTDRPMWSDSTGRIKRSKDTTRLLNMHWQWVTDWNIDFTTPGGVDSEGWQYATDFPTSYHSRKTMTDYVRRRRWSRKCKLNLSGPWQEVGNSKIIDISIHVLPAVETMCIWAVGTNGDLMFRKGVSESNPSGDTWEQVPCDEQLQCVSCGFGSQVWAVSKKGMAIWRFGITTSNPIGSHWEVLDSPHNAVLKRISVARWSVWALDTGGNLYIRHEVSPVFPEGSHWEQINKDGETFIDISASNGEIWAINEKRALCRRIGVSMVNPCGTMWDCGIAADWKRISCRGLVMK